MSRGVSDARKEELKGGWVENQFYPELERKEIIRGAFDSKSLSTRDAHVIALRRPGHLPAGNHPQAPEPKPKRPPMTFSARQSMGMESHADKFGLIREGPPNRLGLSFKTRSVPEDVANKFGTGRPITDLEAPPPTLNLVEDFD